MKTETPIRHRFRFPKAEHLKSRKAIEELFKSGKSFFVHPYKVLYQFEHTLNVALATAEKNGDSEILEKGGRSPARAHLLAGFAASSRNFKKAVDRNRVKRVGREAFRLNKNNLTDLLVAQNLYMDVFFVYAGKTLPTFEATDKQMKTCLERLAKQVSNQVHHEKLL